MPDRDYAAEMRAVIDAEAQGTYAAPVVAQQIVDKLRATDPDLLIGYLEVSAVQIIRHAINQRDCSVRTHNRLTSRPRPSPPGPQGREVFEGCASRPT